MPLNRNQARFVFIMVANVLCSVWITKSLLSNRWRKCLIVRFDSKANDSLKKVRYLDCVGDSLAVKKQLICLENLFRVRWLRIRFLFILYRILVSVRSMNEQFDTNLRWKLTNPMKCLSCQIKVGVRKSWMTLIFWVSGEMLATSL